MMIMMIYRKMTSTRFLDFSMSKLICLGFGGSDRVLRSAGGRLSLPERFRYGVTSFPHFYCSSRPRIITFLPIQVVD